MSYGKKKGRSKGKPRAKTLRPKGKGKGPRKYFTGGTQY